MLDSKWKQNARRVSSVYRGMLILGAALIIVLILLAGYRSVRRFAAAKSRDFMSPFLNATVGKEDKAIVEGLMLNSKLTLARKIAALTHEKNNFAADNAMLRSLEMENKQLRALTGVPRKMNYAPVFAEVQARAIPTWRERFVINRGEKDGITVGDVVVAMDVSGFLSVAGRIKEVSKHTAVVVTLYSKECRLSAMLASSRLCGGLEFETTRKGPVIKYLPADGMYAEKEIAVTSGISAYTPAGLRIGEVKADASGNVAVIRDQMFAEVIIRSFVEIDTVKFVAVYTRKLPK